MPYFKVLNKLTVQTYYQSFVFEVLKVKVVNPKNSMAAEPPPCHSYQSHTLKLNG